MNVLKAIRKRRSIGKLDGHVAEDDLRTIVEAGLWAPNHKLSDPTRYVALRGDARVKLGEVWGPIAVAGRDLSKAKHAEAIAKESGKPLRAPLLLVVSVCTSDDEVRAREDYATGCAAAQNVLLAAVELGYGAIWRTGDMVRSPEVIAHLGLAPSDRIVGIIYIGKMIDEPPSVPNRNVDEHLVIRG